MQSGQADAGREGTIRFADLPGGDVAKVRILVGDEWSLEGRLRLWVMLEGDGRHDGRLSQLFKSCDERVGGLKLLEGAATKTSFRQRSGQLGKTRIREKNDESDTRLERALGNKQEKRRNQVLIKDSLCHQQ